MLRGELAHGDVVIATARPVLRHLLASGDQALFSDEVLARVRGMGVHVARQMLMALAAKADVSDRGAFVEERTEPIAVSLLNDPAILAHAHSLAIEAQIADRLHRRSGIDPVLSPLVQNQAASDDHGIAAAAMHVLSAQARFMQQQRRMELPLVEMPAELVEIALDTLRMHNDDLPEETGQVHSELVSMIRPEASRIGQMTALVSAMKHRAMRALEVDNAGVAIFATALSMAAGQPRDVVLLSFGENQCARLAVSLRAAGLGQSAVEEQFLYLHPEIELPDGFEMLRTDRANALLATAQSGGGQ